MNDKEIRQVLKPWIKLRFNPLSIREEMPIGTTRIDLTAFTDCLIGFEIKSDQDTLTRLKNQVRCYERVCRMNYVVVSYKHQSKICDYVPMQWGILIVKDNVIIEYRHPIDNLNVKADDLLRLVWKVEIVSELRKKDIKGLSNCSRGYVEKMALDNLTFQEILALTIENAKYQRT